MSCCLKKNTPEAQVNAKINSELRKERILRSKLNVIKLLLLGTGESGKSTLAKQMKILYMNGFTEEELRNLIPHIHYNIITVFKDILRKALKKLALPEAVKEDIEFMTTLRPQEKLTPEIAGRMKTLAQTHELTKVIRRLKELQLIDHFDYMYDKIDEIASPEYVPKVEDVLKTRIKSTGINEIEYQYENSNFLVVDMGGQRSERSKWMCYIGKPDITAVIFVVALNEYDMTLREAPDVNRMHESLTVFKNIINLEQLKDTPIILFLNKMDLFKSKIEHVDLKQCFPDYTGERHSYDPALLFIAEKFKSFDMNKDRQIFTHPTCATDTNQIKIVLADVKLALIKGTLKGMGIL